MAVGHNTVHYYTAVGGAHIAATPAQMSTYPWATENVGTFTWPPNPVNLRSVVVNETGGSNDSASFNDAYRHVSEFGDNGTTNGQKIVGGPMGGREISALGKSALYDSNNVLVGYVSTIGWDVNNDGFPHADANNLVFGSVLGFVVTEVVPGALVAGQTYHTTPVPGDGDGGFLYSQIAPICFCRGTLIGTDGGAVAVETLRVGDLVQTRDHGLQPIRWIGNRSISQDELASAPNFAPIRIKAGALGRNMPAADLVVSPQHRMVIRSKIAERLFGTAEALVAAKQLLSLPGVDLAPVTEEVVYIHLLLDRHEVIFANGAETESLFLGPMTLRSFSRAAYDEVVALFPELARADFVAQSATTMLNGKQGRALVNRHARHGRPVVEGLAG